MYKLAEGILDNEKTALWGAVARGVFGNPTNMINSAKNIGGIVGKTWQRNSAQGGGTMDFINKTRNAFTKNPTAGADFSTIGKGLGRAALGAGLAYGGMKAIGGLGRAASSTLKNFVQPVQQMNQPQQPMPGGNYANPGQMSNPYWNYR